MMLQPDMTTLRLDSVLPNERRSDVTIVLGERHENMQELLISALLAQRLSQIQAVGSLQGVVEALEHGEPDILLLDGGLKGRQGTPFDLVRDIRQGKIGKNPFMAIILTLWQPDTATIARAGNCGADGLLVKPIAPAALVERIAQVAEARKRYVAAGDYVGPDRRLRNHREFPTEPVDVPNSLSLKAQGCFDAAGFARQLAQAEDGMRRLWLRRQALRVAALAKVVAFEPSDEAFDLLASVTDEMGQGLHGIAKSGKAAEALLADALAQVTRGLAGRKSPLRSKAVGFLPALVNALLLTVMPNRPRASLEDEIHHLAETELERIEGAQFQGRQHNAYAERYLDAAVL